jgi:hypothetical protein
VNRGGRWAGRGLITAGTILTVVGLGIILVKTVRLPGYWMPFIVGVGLLLAGLIVWATSRDSSH